LLPDAVQEKLTEDFALLAPYRHAAFLRGVLELAVVADCGDEVPTIFFQQPDDFFNLVAFHYSLSLLLDDAKVILLIPLCKLL